MFTPIFPPGLLPRRSFLHAGVVAALSKMAGPFAGTPARAAAGPGSRLGKARSIILIFNGGAPSHIDLWDPKPEASSQTRGIFSPVATDVDGLRITELLPRMAILGAAGR
jgi:hypothetical protein